MPSQQTIDLLVRTLGVDAVKQLQGQLQLTQNDINNLTNAMRAQAVVSADDVKELDKLVQKQRELNQAIRQAEGGFKLSANAARNLSYVTQDLAQGGIGGIVNNITGLTESLGGGAGLAAIFTGVGTAMLLLQPVFKQVWAWLNESSERSDDFAGHIKELDKKIKELTDKPHKLSIDYAALDDAKRQVDRMKETLDAFEKLDKSKSTIQEGVAKGVTEAIVEHAGQGDKESGVSKIQAAVLRVLKASGMDKQLVPGLATAEDQQREADEAKAFANSRGLTLEARVGAQRGAEAAQARADETLAAARNLLANKAKEFTDGTEANRAKLAEMVKNAPAAFGAQGINPREFGLALERASASKVKTDIERKEAAEWQAKINAANKKQDDEIEQRAKQGQTAHEQEVGRIAASLNDTAKGFDPIATQKRAEGTDEDSIRKMATEYFTSLLKNSEFLKGKDAKTANEVIAKVVAKSLRDSLDKTIKHAEGMEFEAGPGGADVTVQQAAADEIADAKAKGDAPGKKKADREADKEAERKAKKVAEDHEAVLEARKKLDAGLAGSYAAEALADTDRFEPPAARQLRKDLADKQRRDAVRAEFAKHSNNPMEVERRTAEAMRSSQSEFQEDLAKAKKGTRKLNPMMAREAITERLLNVVGQNQDATAEMIGTVAALGEKVKNLEGRQKRTNRNSAFTRKTALSRANQ